MNTKRMKSILRIGMQRSLLPRRREPVEGKTLKIRKSLRVKSPERRKRRNPD